jgi:hypothetical protein
LSPFCFCGALFSSNVFLSPFHFWGVSFSIRGLFVAPFIFWEPLSLSEVFFSQSARRGGSDRASLLMASLLGAKVLVKCIAILISDFDLEFS